MSKPNSLAQTKRSASGIPSAWIGTRSILDFAWACWWSLSTVLILKRT